MRLISIDEYNPAVMQLARPIYDKYKRVLLGAGRIIHPVYLEKLKALDIRYLFVEDAVAYGITMDEMLNLPSWMDGVETVEKAYKAVERKEEFPVREIQKLVVKLVDEVSKRKALILIPTTLLPDGLRQYAHPVNVVLLSMQIAKKLGISQIQLKDLATGCLLHDIGKALTSIEEDHPVAGFDYLRKIREFNLLVAHVAYQHHECIDGTGIPRRLKDQEIHEFAQVCSIANLYDHALSDRGFPPHEAMEYVMTKSGTMFSKEIVEIFAQQIPIYIPGTKVRLNNGKKAIITKILGNIHRPYIRYLDSNEEFSLTKDYTLLITEVLNEKDERDT